MHEGFALTLLFICMPCLFTCFARYLRDALYALLRGGAEGGEEYIVQNVPHLNEVGMSSVLVHLDEEHTVHMKGDFRLKAARL